MPIVLVQLKPNPSASLPMSYALANNSHCLLAVPRNEERFKYRAYRPNLPFDGHGIHSDDIDQVFDLDYAKQHFPELLI